MKEIFPYANCNNEFNSKPIIFMKIIVKNLIEITRIIDHIIRVKITIP